MRARFRAAGTVLGVMLEGIQEGNRRRNFEFGRGVGHLIHVGGRGGSNAVGNIDRFRVKHLTLGTEPNSPLTYAPGLELHHPIMSNFGDPGGRLERESYISIQ